MCIKTTGTSNDDTTDGMFLSRNNPLISFTISAPASTACFATIDFVVSIEIKTTESVFRIDLMTGMIRFNSSFTEIGAAPGREDSPPISRISAPSLISDKA